MRKTFIPLLVIPAILPAADISPSCATGTVTASVKSYYIISCGSNRIEILKDRAPGLTPGDRILLPPRIHPYASPDPKLDAFVLVGHEPLPPPPLSILQDIDPARTDKQRVRIRGWIKDSDYDPLDKNWMRLVLKSGRETIDVAVPIPPNTPFPPKTFRFSTIEVIGLYRRMIQGGRLFATASIEVSNYLG